MCRLTPRRNRHVASSLILIAARFDAASAVPPPSPRSTRWRRASSHPPVDAEEHVVRCPATNQIGVLTTWRIQAQFWPRRAAASARPGEERARSRDERAKGAVTAAARGRAPAPAREIAARMRSPELTQIGLNFGRFSAYCFAQIARSAHHRRDAAAPRCASGSGVILRIERLSGRQRRRAGRCRMLCGVVRRRRRGMRRSAREIPPTPIARAGRGGMDVGGRFLEEGEFDLRRRRVPWTTERGYAPAWRAANGNRPEGRGGRGAPRRARVRFRRRARRARAGEEGHGARGDPARYGTWTFVLGSPSRNHPAARPPAARTRPQHPANSAIGASRCFRRALRVRGRRRLAAAGAASALASNNVDKGDHGVLVCARAQPRSSRLSAERGGVRDDAHDADADGSAALVAHLSVVAPSSSTRLQPRAPTRGAVATAIQRRRARARRTRDKSGGGERSPSPPRGAASEGARRRGSGSVADAGPRPAAGRMSRAAPPSRLRRRRLPRRAASSATRAATPQSVRDRRFHAAHQPRVGRVDRALCRRSRS